MNLKPIRCEDELNAAFVRLGELWGTDSESPESEELEVLSILIEKYEDEHYPIAHTGLRIPYESLLGEA